MLGAHAVATTTAWRLCLALCSHMVLCEVTACSQMHVPVWHIAGTTCRHIVPAGGQHPNSCAQQHAMILVVHCVLVVVLLIHPMLDAPLGVHSAKNAWRCCGWYTFILHVM